MTFACILGTAWGASAQFTPTHSGVRLPLTIEEQAYIAARPVVRLGIDPAWPPFSFLDRQQQFSGIDADLFQLISERTGLRFEVIRTKSWEETDERSTAGEIDVIPSFAYTAARTKEYHFTRSYISTPVALIRRADAPFYSGLHTLSGRVLAAPLRHVTSLHLARDHPEIRQIQVPSSRDALIKVSKGDADGVVDNLVTASYIIKQEGLTNLKIAGLTDYRFELRLGVTHRDPMLFSILERALASLETREIFQIQDRWVSINVEETAHWQRISQMAIGIAGVLGFLFLVFFGWTYSLKHELRARRIVEENLRQNEEELRAKNRLLNSLNAEKDTLMSMVAHDLNGPLTAVSLSVTALADERNDNRTTELLDSAQQGLERMSRLTKNLLSANALEHGQLPVFMERGVHPAEVITRVAERYQPHSRGKQIAIHLNVDSALGMTIQADQHALDEVLDNLFSNALKFTPSGGQVVVETSTESNNLQIAIQDSGPGFKPDELPRLFGKFSRLSNRPTGGESSHGLGLLIVKRLTEAMGGKIAARNREEGGACFTLRFPLDSSLGAVKNGA